MDKFAEYFIMSPSKYAAVIRTLCALSAAKRREDYKVKKTKAKFIDSKAKKIVLTVEAVLCLVFFIPFYLQNQLLVAGFAADSNNNLAVVVNNVFGGAPLYLYIYDNNGNLLNYKTIRNIRGGIEAITSEDDMICMYQYNSRYFYDFNGEYKKTEPTINKSIGK